MVSTAPISLVMADRARAGACSSKRNRRSPATRFPPLDYLTASLRSAHSRPEEHLASSGGWKNMRLLRPLHGFEAGFEDCAWRYSAMA